MTQPTPNTHPQLYDKQGRPKYLTPAERNAFLHEADKARPDIRTLSMLLAYTGCYPSEAIALTADCFDISGHAVLFQNINKCSTTTPRSVPAPPLLMDALDTVHDLRNMQKTADAGQGLRPWPIHRITAWSHIRHVMHQAQIEGPQATPRGLRHSFALDALSSGVPIETLHYWLGHTHLKSTLFYMQNS